MTRATVVMGTGTSLNWLGSVGSAFGADFLNAGLFTA
jgi:hypothetical protein